MTDPSRCARRRERLTDARRGSYMLDVRPRVGSCVSRMLQLTGIELWPVARSREIAIRARHGQRGRHTPDGLPSRIRLIRR